MNQDVFYQRIDNLSEEQNLEHVAKELILVNLQAPRESFQTTFGIPTSSPNVQEDTFMQGLNAICIETYFNFGKSAGLEQTVNQVTPKQLTLKVLNQAISTPDTLRESQTPQIAEIQPNLTQMQVEQENVLDRQHNQENESMVNVEERRIDTKVEDKKNIPGNALKFALKAYSNPRYRSIVAKIHAKCKIQNPSQAIQYYSSKVNWVFGLNNVKEELDQVGNQTERAYRKSFLIFFRWLMRKVYPIHVITEPKIKIKDEYLRIKNMLIYLPEAQKKNKRARKNQKTPIPDFLDEEEHLVHHFNLLGFAQASNTSPLQLYSD